MTYPVGFRAYQWELAAGRRWAPLTTRALGTVISECLAPGIRVRGPVEGPPDHVELAGGLSYRFWRVPVLQMVGSGALCAPGRVPGNSAEATDVTPVSELPAHLQSWKLADVIAATERQSWIDLAFARLSGDHADQKAMRASFVGPEESQLNVFR